MATVSGVLSASQITALIQQASTAYQAPATALQAQEQPIKTQISALGQVQSALSGLQSALGQLANVQSLSQRSVTSTPNGTVSATVTNDAAIGTYSISNIQLAHNESLTSSGFASSSAALGAGTLTFQVGSGSAVTVNVPSGQDSLAGVASAINQANAGVEAAVVFDGSTYHLTITGDGTGTANAFTVSGTGGLSSLTYDSLVHNMTQTQAAANASFALNGIAITSGSNNVSGVVDGLSFTLMASGSATVSVAQSVSALDQAAHTVVSALNNALGTINKYASYSPVSGGGPLLGDVGLQVIRTDLLTAISAPAPNVPSTSPYTSLGSIGFSITSGGMVTLDDGKLQSAAQANYAAVAALLGQAGIAGNANVSVQGVGSAQPGTYAVDVTTNTAGSILGTINGQIASGSNGVLTVTGPGAALGLSLHVAAGVTGSLGTVTVSQGLYGQLMGVLNAALDAASGSLTKETSNLNDTITSMDKQIASLQKEAQQQTLALTQQFSIAQSTITQLSNVSQFLTTFFNMPSGNGSSGG